MGTEERETERMQSLKAESSVCVFWTAVHFDDGVRERVGPLSLMLWCVWTCGAPSEWVGPHSLMLRCVWTCIAPSEWVGPRSLTLQCVWTRASERSGWNFVGVRSAFSFRGLSGCSDLLQFYSDTARTMSLRHALLTLPSLFVVVLVYNVK